MQRFTVRTATALALIVVAGTAATAAVRERMAPDTARVVDHRHRVSASDVVRTRETTGGDRARSASVRRSHGSPAKEAHLKSGHPRASVHGGDVRARARETLAALRYRWPVHGPINSGFGARRWSRSHHGVDIGAERNTPVRAPAAGTVAFAGWRNGYGRTVVIDHGHGLRTLYGHLSKVGVGRAQKIEQGAVIGSTGSTGAASGPHLHYEVLVNDRPVNPRDRVSMAGPPKRTGAGPERRTLPPERGKAASRETREKVKEGPLNLLDALRSVLGR